MEPFGYYLRSRRESRGMTLEELAHKAQVSPSLISKIERGQRGVPKIDRLQALAEALGVDLDEVMSAARQDKEEAKQAESLDVTPAEERPSYKAEPDESIQVPLVRDIKPGQPWWLEEFRIGSDWFLKAELHTGYQYLHLEITDDHMQGEGILPGSLVLVKVGSDVPHGKIAFVSIKGERKATLRRIFWAMDVDCVMFQAANPRVAPRIVPLRELGATAEIIGEAVRVTTLL